MSSEYRDQVRRVEHEVPFTLWTAFKWGLGVIIVLAILGYIAQATGIINMNIKRETIQHSQQYVETKVNLLNKLHHDWLQLNTEIIELRAGEGNDEIVAAKQAQQKNTAQRIRTEASMIPSSQLPSDIQNFLDSHPQ